MPQFAIIEVPSNLGLRPSGVEHLPDALREGGLAARLGARIAHRVEAAAPYSAVRDAQTRLLNGPGLHATTQRTATVVAAVIEQGEVPLVLAGDCSIVLGGLLGVRQAAREVSGHGRVGLLFIDGHVDFYQPEASPTGEVADMDLALATGRGPTLLAHLDPGGPLVLDADVAAVGARDANERDAFGGQDIRRTAIRLLELQTVHARGVEAVAAEALGVVARPELDAGFWLHLDADVLDDAVMPAVDYRQASGLAPAELVVLLRAAERSGRLAGVSVAIYNPTLDPDRLAARTLVDSLSTGLGDVRRS